MKTAAIILAVLLILAHPMAAAAVLAAELAACAMLGALIWRTAGSTRTRGGPPHE